MERRLAAALRFALAWLSLCSAPAALAEQLAPRVVATIAPVHSLVASVMQGAGVPQLLIDGALSEHTYALKPSDARKLSSAQIVVRVAPNLETFLDKTLANLPKSARTVSLDAIPGLSLWPIRAGGNFEPHVHQDEDKGEHEHEHEHGGSVDPHLWLDPANAAVIADSLAETLAGADPVHASLYKSNAEAFKTRLRALDEELRAELKPAQGKPYIVFHDAYQYFERRYGLSPAGSISLSSAQQPSAGHLRELRRKVERLGATCVFSEPQFDAKLARTLVEGTSAKTAALDGLGANLPPGPELYFALERKLAKSLVTCLRE